MKRRNVSRPICRINCGRSGKREIDAQEGSSVLTRETGVKAKYIACTVEFLNLFYSTLWVVMTSLPTGKQFCLLPLCRIIHTPLEHLPVLSIPQQTLLIRLALVAGF